MHGSFESSELGALPLGSILQLDRALRQARAGVLAAGKLNDPLWAVLLELTAAPNGLSFEALEAGPATQFGRTTLLGCLSTLEETGLIIGDNSTELPLLSHVEISQLGRSKVDAVLAGALAILRRGG